MHWRRSKQLSGESYSRAFRMRGIAQPWLRLSLLLCFKKLIKLSPKNYHKANSHVKRILTPKRRKMKKPNPNLSQQSSSALRFLCLDQPPRISSKRNSKVNLKCFSCWLITWKQQIKVITLLSRVKPQLNRLMDNGWFSLFCWALLSLHASIPLQSYENFSVRKSYTCKSQRCCLSRWTSLSVLHHFQAKNTLIYLLNCLQDKVLIRNNYRFQLAPPGNLPKH